MHAIVSRLRRASLGVLVLLAGLPLAIPAVPASAATVPVWSYVWAYDPTAPSYKPNFQSQFNSDENANTVTRNGVGIYTVTFPGMGVPGGTAHATAYGSGTEQCKVKRWNQGPVTTDLQVVVGCFGLTGAPVDSMFMLAFTAEQAATLGQMAYLLSDQVAPALNNTYTPSSTYQFNSKGVRNTVTRTSTGVYWVRLPQLGSAGGHVQVTAFGDGSQRCKVDNWRPTENGADELVFVRCFSSTGAPADSRFTLTYVNHTTLIGDGGNDSIDIQTFSAYLWADQPRASNWYVPNLSYQDPSTASYVNQVERVGVGYYRLYLPAVGDVGNDLQVTAQGTGAEFCKIGDKLASGTGTVRCFDSHGAPVDTRFNVTAWHTHVGP